MFTGNKFTVSVLSALTLAILTACGGSSEEFTLDRDHKWSHEPDRAKKEKRKHAELPAVNIPAPTSFLEGAKKMKQTDDDNKEDKAVSKRQEGNVVTVVDHDYGYKTVKFNQSGMVDHLCMRVSESGVCKIDDNKVANGIKNKEKEKKAAEGELAKIQKSIDDYMKTWDENHKNAEFGEREKELERIKELNKISDIEDRIEILEEELNELNEANKNMVFFLKSDGTQRLPNTSERILTKENYKNSYSKEKDIEDAGIVPVAGFYDKNGDLRVQKGMVGREFDGIIVLENEVNQKKEVVKRSYLRDPVAAGWSYNTFGVFQDSTKSIERGYQSIGVKTRTSAQKRKEADESFEVDKGYENLPYYGRATYTGIGHAYHNDEQVTMNVKVDADFHDRHLNFETSNATAHTFEKEGHLTRVRPDLDLKGAADWAADVADFKGKVHNVGGNLEGQLEGSFYGPKAPEVGGVYGLHGKDKEGKPVNYVGGFGAKRP
ncbi:transferrin-binding protein-like solute binding protein [Dichelobacter nodosus]|uniref:Hypothetical lipoprotein n=1 Tax=Dichelobacter nodosus (strain VCS1703A) TaxID=246195 RepID=A5EXB8_DICNV|nr:transferrin-binding protein-like solute binding protein [Dichelobacter nodosus]ABQ13388.1 hypothetical lipoprotein [Dichelobacter nodosus VCS1703A]